MKSDSTHQGFGGVMGQRSPLAGHATVVTPTRDPAEAIKAAGLDWTVEKRPLWFTGKGNGSKPVKVAGHFATVKVSDDGEQLLGTVRAGYTAVQNEEAFEWAKGLGEFAFGGSLRGGGQVYLGVKLDRQLDLAGEPADYYMVLWNGHDGSKSVGGMATPIRLRCLNQLSYARSKSISHWFARHTSGVAVKAKSNLDNLMELIGDHADHLELKAQTLHRLKVSPDRAHELVAAALPGRTRLIEEVLENLETTDTLDDAQRRTGWGVLQATTEYFEWKRDAATTESAFQSTLDGVGARAARALESGLLVPA